jgi:acetoacetyl-[acyl-carrier protein] synthase
MLVLCDDDLALEMGAQIYGAVSDVFINADGHKKSISAPGVGNYITVAKAVAAARNLVGEECLAQGFVQAHGTGTPQNRVTESHILNEVARRYGIRRWPVAAVKAYLGHSIGCAGGDQLVATLGCWQHGLLPGIATIDHVAEDVHADCLDISPAHRELDTENAAYAIINAKGFGGNNASATVLSPQRTRRMLEKRHGREAILAWSRSNEASQQRAEAFEAESLAGEARPVYRFDHHVMQAEDVRFDDERLRLGDSLSVDLALDNPYKDMC